MDLTSRQDKIINIVKHNEPITSLDIADKLEMSRAAIRSDLTVLTMLDILAAKPKVGYYYNEDREELKDIEKLFNLPVCEVMSMPLNIKENISIYDAVVSMFLEDVGTIYVIDENEKLSGVISRKDLLKISIGQTELKKTPVSLAMTRMPNIITIKQDDTYFEAAKRISLNKIDSLPVITDEYKVVGRISKTNITNYIVEFDWEN